MGMAASQARYLEITARKTNVEYAGQQINQQRTALANQSAGLFTQLMALNVPTAPNTANYTTTSYKFNNGANNCTITNIQSLTGDPLYNSNVTYDYTESVYKGLTNARSDLSASLTGTTYWLGTTKLSATDTASPTDMAAILQVATDVPASTLATAYNNYIGGISPTLDIHQYTSTNGVTYYLSQADLAAKIADPTKSVTLGYAGNIDKLVSTTEKAYLTQESSGRYSTVGLQNSSSTFNLSATSAVDETAYANAINEYEFQQASYEQQIQNLNAKTEVIQQEDKVLELKLKQLDTEQQALQTEMESVKKVIDKNIEETFKTFQ